MTGKKTNRAAKTGNFVRGDADFANIKIVLANGGLAAYKVRCGTRLPVSFVSFGKERVQRVGGKRGGVQNMRPMIRATARRNDDIYLPGF